MIGIKMNNNEYTPGIEKLPPRHFQRGPLPILVIVYNLLNEDDIAVEKEIDYSSFEDRKWLGAITHWAVTNHHSVETMAMIDAKAPTK